MRTLGILGPRWLASAVRRGVLLALLPLALVAIGISGCGTQFVHKGPGLTISGPALVSSTHPGRFIVNDQGFELPKAPCPDRAHWSGGSNILRPQQPQIIDSTITPLATHTRPSDKACVIDGVSVSAFTPYSPTVGPEKIYVCLSLTRLETAGNWSNEECTYASTAPESAFRHVYWDNNTNAIGRANLDGSEKNLSFVTGAESPCGVAVDASHIYWANPANGSGGAGTTIGRANLDGSGVNQNFITGATDPCGVAVDAGHIYWGNFPSTIGRANIDGSAASVNQSFITGTGGSYGIAVDAGHIYWTNYSNTIGRANIDGAAASVNQSFISLKDGSVPLGVAVDAAHIYWANTGKAASGTTIGRANIDGSAASVNESFVSGANGPCGVAVDAGHVYWSNTGPGVVGTTIGRANLDGSSPSQTFITGAGAGCGVALDLETAVAARATAASARSARAAPASASTKPPRGLTLGWGGQASGVSPAPSLSYGPHGSIAVRKATLIGRLALRLGGPRESRRRVPAAIKDLLRANFRASLSGTYLLFAPLNDPLVASGLIATRSSAHHSRFACLRMTPIGKGPLITRTERLTLLGGTGPLAHLQLTATMTALPTATNAHPVFLTLSIRHKRRGTGLGPCAKLARRVR